MIKVIRAVICIVFLAPCLYPAPITQAQLFDSRTEFSIGASPDSVATGELDGNGTRSPKDSP